jgi:hypothetical protein
VAEAHGGRLSLESLPGRGCSFKLSILLNPYVWADAITRGTEDSNRDWDLPR